MFGYVDEAEVVVFFVCFLIQSHTGSLAIEKLDFKVRGKAHGRDEGWASPGYRCYRLCSSLGCGRARLCSPEIHRDNFRLSPHPPALL